MTIDPPILEPQLNCYFAVQMLRGESVKQVAGAICQAGSDQMTLFRRLEVLDVIQIASYPFLRCRSDIIDNRLVLETLAAQQRGYVTADAGGRYTVRLSDGRVGPVTGMTMHTTSKPGHQRMFKGPKIKLWSRQFGVTDEGIAP